MYCPNCKKEFTDAKFCPECGTKAGSVATESIAVPQEADGRAADSPMAQYTSSAEYSSNVQNSKEKAPRKKHRGRRFVCVILVLAVALIFVKVIKANSLSDSQKAEVKQVVSSISELPKDISLSEKSKINSVLKQYNDLSDKQKKKVKNHKTLEKAQKSLNKLEIDEAEKAIEAIGTVTENSGDAIANARKLYTELPDELKEKVKGKEKLDNAQKEYEKINAEKVIKLIDNLGEISLDSKDKIEEIEKIYKGLPAESKKLVTNYAAYTAKKDKYDALVITDRQSKFKAALSKLKSKYDKVEQCTWYNCSTKPKYINDRSYFLPYLRYNDDGSMRMRIRAVCVNDEWIFWDTYKFLIDGKTYTKSFSYFQLERDVNTRNNWEYADYLCRDEDVALLRILANSDSAVIRFRGDAHQKDVTISAADKAAIRDLLAAYDAYNAMTQ